MLSLCMVHKNNISVDKRSNIIKSTPVAKNTNLTHLFFLSSQVTDFIIVHVSHRWRLWWCDIHTGLGHRKLKEFVGVFKV